MCESIHVSTHNIQILHACRYIMCININMNIYMYVFNVDMNRHKHECRHFCDTHTSYLSIYNYIQITHLYKHAFTWFYIYIYICVKEYIYI